MGVRVASSIVIPQAKTHSYSIGTQEAAALERANAFGKETNMLWFIPLIIFTLFP
jgi:hypothetical protein